MENEKIETLISADEYLYNLKNGVARISELIQEGKEQEGINLIPHVAEGIQWLTEAVELTRDVHKSEISFDSLNEFIEEISEALENEDYILVGDLFNYEILPILENVHEGIKETVAN